MTVLLHSKNDFDATHAELIKSRFEIGDKDTQKMTQAEFSSAVELNCLNLGIEVIKVYEGYSRDVEAIQADVKSHDFLEITFACIHSYQNLVTGYNKQQGNCPFYLTYYRQTIVEAPYFLHKYNFKHSHDTSTVLTQTSTQNEEVEDTSSQ